MDPVSHTSFRCLGPLVIGCGRRDVHIRQSPSARLLSALLINVNEVVPRAQLVEEAWGPTPPRTSTNSLYVQIGRLRHRLSDWGGTATITVAQPGYVLRTAPEHVDLHSFVECVRLAQAAQEADP